MARRRPTARGKSSRRKTLQTRRYFTEALESRTYFVVLHEGDVFEFFADNNQMERVVVQGNSGSTTLELIGSHSSSLTGLFPGQAPNLTSMDGVIVAGPDRGQVGAGLPPAAFQGNGGTGNNTNAPVFTDDIYAIFVSKSDSSTRIAIAGTPLLSQPNRPMQPFTGNVPLLIAPNTGGAAITVSTANSGTAILGARAFPQTITGNGGGTNANFPTNEPVFGPSSFPAGTFPTLPSNQTSISAGLTVAQGNNLGEFLFGGTIMGDVNIHGSVGLFYAGWIVTGNAVGNGGANNGAAVNFSVDGDVQNLLTNSSIGTNTDSANFGNPVYTSGFNMHVGGKVGTIRSLDSIVGTIDVIHDPNAPGLAGTVYQEVNRRAGSWDNAIFAGDPILTNDTFLGAQFLTGIDNGGDVAVSGQIEGLSLTDNNSVDYYAVPLLAGQTVTTRLQNNFIGGLNLGVFDSEQRLIATDYSAIDSTTFAGANFQFTAKLPGVYYFAVTGSINNTFAAGFTPLLGTLPYTLLISGVGDLGIGGIVAANNILDTGLATTSSTGNNAGIHLAHGDLGAVYAGGNIVSNDGGLLGTVFGVGFGLTNAFSVVVDSGNLRDVEGGSIGNGVTPAATSTTGGFSQSTGVGFSSPPSGLVPNGSVGMLRATSTSNASGQGGTGVLLWNIFGLTSTTGAGQLVNPFGSQIAIAGDYQMVDAANFFEGELVANGNIGTIRANNMGSNTPSYFQVNAANDKTKHGTIDLIDVTTNLGLLGAGGPAIITGPGGNCRYIHVPSTGTVFRDFQFGGSQPEGTIYQPGETAVITDDSGAVVSLTPQSALDSLTVITYPVRGSGGAAIVQVQVSGTTGAGTGEGVNVTTSGDATGTAEIGSILVNGTGTAVGAGAAAPAAGGTTGTTAPGSPGGAPVTGPATATTKFTLPTLPGAPALATPATNALDINLSGSATLDVYEITGPVTGTGLTAGVGRVTSISNSTPKSEIVNVHLNSLGTLSTSGTIGESLKSGTAALPTGNFIRADGSSGAPFTYPLFEVSSLVRVLGNVVSISASGGVGNVYTGLISNGAGGTDPVPAPNSTPQPIPAGGLLQGAAGQIGSVSGPIDGAVVAAGSINSVQANGIGWSGSGAFGGVGIFCANIIGPVTVNGNDYGTIVSTVAQVGVTINNGSFINGTIADFERFDYTETRRGVSVIPTSATPITRPQLDIGGITVKGNGGILGSQVLGNHVGPVTVAPTGFGIFDTLFAVLGDGTFLGITGGGYGVRDVFVAGGASVGALSATGDGSSLPITNFPSNVRNSEQGLGFSPITGQLLSPANDLDTYLGTSLATPILNGSTESGVIEDTVIIGSRDVGSVNAWAIRGRSILGNAAFFPIATVTVINIANTVNQMNVRGPVSGFFVTTGRTGKFNFGGDVGGFVLSVAGPIGNLVFNSSLLDSSSISAQGNSGKIASILIHGNFSGSINAFRSIGKITIEGSIIGTITAATLGTLKLTGGIGNGTLSITGNVGTIQTVGDLGVPGNTLTVNGTLGKLQVGGNLNTSVSVAGNLTNLLVAGSILSAANVTVANTITLMKIGRDVEAGAVISAHIIKKKLIGGQLLGTITTA